MGDKFKELRQFFGGNFHQDWMVDFKDEKQALKSFVFEEDVDRIRIVIRELDEFIALGLQEPELEQAICNDLWSDYYPDTDYKDMNDWLRFIRDTMAKYAAEKAKQEKAESAKSKQ